MGIFLFGFYSLSQKESHCKCILLLVNATVSLQVHHVGQFVVGVVGETREDALKGAKQVHIDYEPLAPILSIEVMSDRFYSNTF